ncbi:MAG: polysaccharide export protein [Hyphomicrobiaceae bacterium]|nr:polysaccharide export protein [Hyphomicrobiaceae bacterium]
MLSALLGGCAHLDGEVAPHANWQPTVTEGAPPHAPRPAGPPLVHVGVNPSWGVPTVEPIGLKGPRAVADSDGPYLLDTGDQLRIFVYGQPNLSRMYKVDHAGKVSIPLIGPVRARGRTVYQLAAAIRYSLGAKYVRDPQVTVDIQENRPFFILGEVRNGGQFPYVNGMTVKTAVAIAGGFTERANEKIAILSRRINGMVEVIEAPMDYVMKPGDTIHVKERLF